MVKDRMYQKEYTDSVMDGMVIARLESHGHGFEVIVEADAVEDIREGKEKNILDRLPEETIFKDARKGERASDETVKEVFENEDMASIVRKIVTTGQVQLTTEQRRQMMEDKRKQVIAQIARDAMNPQTKTPHPPQRIELAMKEANVHIDPFKPVNVQVVEVVELLRPLLPISFEKIKMAVKVAATDYGRCYGDIKSFGKITREEWQPDGSWVGIVEIPGGVQTDFMSKLGEKTKGTAETKIIK